MLSIFPYRIDEVELQKPVTEINTEPITGRFLQRMDAVFARARGAHGTQRTTIDGSRYLDFIVRGLLHLPRARVERGDRAYPQGDNNGEGEHDLPDDHSARGEKQVEESDRAAPDRP